MAGIAELRVDLSPDVPEHERDRLSRCLDLFEDFCIVTQSVRDGIDVDVRVEPHFPAAPEPPGEGELVGSSG